jgi:hypothetical protein
MCLEHSLLVGGGCTVDPKIEVLNVGFGLHYREAAGPWGPESIGGSDLDPTS